MEYRPSSRRLVANHQGSTSAVEPSHLRRAVDDHRSLHRQRPVAEVLFQRKLCQSPGNELEAAMAAVGESDPTFSHLQDALMKAKAQCQVVEDRIVASIEFIERAKKRICQVEVSQGQEALAKVQSKLQFEEQGLDDGEARLAALIQESAEAGPRVDCPPISSRACGVASMSV